MSDPRWAERWWAGCPEHGQAEQPSGSCHECAMLMPPLPNEDDEATLRSLSNAQAHEPEIGGVNCDRCEGEIERVQDDPEYRSGMTVQVGAFSLRVDDPEGDSYDEPDNDQRWFCQACWGEIRLHVQAIWASKPKGGA